MPVSRDIVQTGKVGESEVQGHFWLRREVKTSLNTYKERRKKKEVPPPPYYHRNPQPRGVRRWKMHFIPGRKPQGSPRSQSALHTEISFPASICWSGRWQYKPAIKNAQPAWKCGCPTQSLCPSACQRTVRHFREAGSLVKLLWYQNQQELFPWCGEKERPSGIHCLLPVQKT